ncbi:hypothetical protein J2T13_004922 [Paenibacillus sp. DS2015]|uniref:hypothetical protein n=1 Tax=Paenibacillus sp. DS2015 TaxID=3373917 RepID=UPI003D235100
MLLWLGDQIEYRTTDGKTMISKVAGVTGSKIYLQNGGVTYESYVIRKIENK